MELENVRPQPRQALTTAQVIDRLKAEAETNKVFNAICHVFSIRERARQQITLVSLRLKMIQEGFDYPKDEIGKCLKLLAGLGLGYLELEANKDVKALKNIKVTLQSIGRAALNKEEPLEKFSVPVEYNTLPSISKEAIQAAPMKKRDTAPDAIVPRRYKASIRMVVDGKDIFFELPKQITMSELSQILAKTGEGK